MAKVQDLCKSYSSSGVSKLYFEQSIKKIPKYLTNPYTTLCIATREAHGLIRQWWPIQYAYLIILFLFLSFFSGFLWTIDTYSSGRLLWKLYDRYDSPMLPGGHGDYPGILPPGEVTIFHWNIFYPQMKSMRNCSLCKLVVIFWLKYWAMW